ncbi:MAG: hypothetical protein BWY69_01698 [Planctomycetes bacterium ADurb.Bin401]|jgi:nicotinamide riboside transporter PnuC|nr:MAG: hypothetical protein BWY69_01698 [Planctomycetes bacterium ADurb.Bin401]
MDAIHGYKNWNTKLHRFEQNIADVFEKMIHSEAFWATLIISALLITMILLAIYANTGNTGPYQTPYGPYPYSYPFPYY